MTYTARHAAVDIYADPHFECLERDEACIDDNCPAMTDEEILAARETAQDRATWYDSDR